MRHAATPRVVITGHRRRVAVRRRPRALLGSRQPRLQRHARDHRVRRVRLRLPRGGAGHRRHDRRCAAARRRRRVGRGLPRGSEALFARRADRRHRRARSVGRRGLRDRRARTPASSSAAAAAGSTSASGSITTSSSSAAGRSRRTRFPCRSSAWCRARSRFRCGCAASATCSRAAARARPTRIGYAAALMRSGEADVLLSGGADACVTPGMIFGFSRMKVVSTAYNDRPAEASRPFDRGPRRVRARRGRVDAGARARGSGARARRDDLRVDRRLRVDLRCVSPRADGAGRRGDRPRDDARDRTVGPPPEEIGYVNYHGTSTLLNDAVESRCVRQVFGAHADAARRIVGQVDDRPSAGRERRRRRGDGRARAFARLPAADDQPARIRSGLRPRLHPEPRPRRRASRRRSATASASDRRTAPSS